MRAPARAAAIALVGALATASIAAHAEPQTSFGLTVGYGARDLEDHARGAFVLGARGDVLFLRNRNRDTAIGPYVEVLSLAFSDLQVGGGVSWLVPGLDAPAIVLSAGAFARDTRALGVQPGAAASLFVGFREHNFSSAYGMANGLFVQGRFGLTKPDANAAAPRQAEVLGGVQIDLALFTLPFLLAWGAIH